MNTQKLLDLASELECNVVYNEPLSKHTTFRTGGACTAMVDISSEESLAKLVRAAHEWNVRYIVVGNGSNLLFDDKGYEGVVFLMGQSVDEIKMMNENTIYAEAGCSLIKLCRFALEHNLTGLEFAYGIPGTVGGAIYMNAGAYDGEIKNVITSANSVRADGTLLPSLPLPYPKVLLLLFLLCRQRFYFEAVIIEGENILVVLKRFKCLHKIFSYSSGVIPCENDYCKAYERQHPVKISRRVSHYGHYKKHRNNAKSRCYLPVMRINEFLLKG